MPEVPSQSPHPKHTLGAGHKNHPGKYRNALAQPVPASANMETPGHTSSVLKRLKENNDTPPTAAKGNMIIIGIGIAAVLYFVFYRG